MEINKQLRQRAEARFLEKISLSPESVETLSPEATRQLLHELRVHQIELEMQNEELRLSQDALDALRAHYFDLYDLAPVGYCTLNETGLILEANLTLASLLGVTRDALANNLLSRFILKEDQDIFYLCRKRLFDSGQPQSCELRMVKHDGTLFWAHLQATAAQAAGGATLESRVILTDISERNALENLQQAEQKLRASLAEKEVLMREIHHRVKNNMQMMSALLELQSGYVKDEQALGFFKDSQQRIQSMAMIHEQLYHNKNLAKIDFAAYLRSLVDALRGQYSERCKQVNIRIDASACTLPVDIAIPCGLVVTELVSNVFKHAFPKGRAGELNIGLQCNGEGKVILEVADDGVGLPAGLDIRHSKSFGLQVVTLMVEKQLHGKLSVESSGQSAARSLSPDSLPRGERESGSLRENLFNHGTRVVCEIGGAK